MAQRALQMPRAVYLHARFKLGALRAVYAFAGKNGHDRLLEKWFSGCRLIHEANRLYARALRGDFHQRAATLPIANSAAAKK